jgi:2-hydroxy-3-oxopropionate reductase
VKIGFIGLGIMGKPMALNLAKAGHALRVYDVRPEPIGVLAAAGAAAAASPADAARGAELVITMVQNSPQVREAVLGPAGVAEGIAPGALYVDMSSIAPAASREIAAALAAKGVAMLDAPVSGGEPKAVAGTLAIMAGGAPEDFERAKPVFAAMGSSAVLCGGVGAGNVVKLANQVIVAVNIAAMSEAFVLAAKAGVDPGRVYDAIKGGLAGSAVLDAKAPKVLAGDYRPGFRIDLHIKDLKNALETARDSGAPLPLAASVLEMMEALSAEGKGAEDHGGLIQRYERLGGVLARAGRAERA